MTETTDAIVIGAGVIGAAVALELNRSGRRTITVDKLPAAGYGPTSGSCAIIRVHYSTYDGIAMAWEGYHYWRDWADYIGCDDEAGIADFRETGCLVMATAQNGFLKKHVDLSQELNIPYEVWDAGQISARLPIYNMEKFHPAKRMDDPEFGKPTGGQVENAVWWPTAGYVTDPQQSTHNLQRATEHNGGRFIFGRTVVDILKEGGRIKGVKLDDGAEIHAPVVVNVAGPRSAHINAMAGALDDMNISTKALKQEVVHVPAPEGFDFYNDGFVVSDSDIGCYVRPEKGNYILIGSEDPECDPREEVDWETYDRNFSDQWTHQAYRYAQARAVARHSQPDEGRGRCLRCFRRLDSDLRQVMRSGLLHGLRNQRQPVQERANRRKMMAALVDYCEGGNDHDANPMPFTLPYIQREVSAGFYSRRRTINPESSMSVIG